MKLLKKQKEGKRKDEKKHWPEGRDPARTSSELSASTV
jgi:hypothetical protein